VLRAFVRSLFGGAPIRDANAATADAQNVLVAAIRELRAVVDSGSAEQIAVAVDVFKSKATEGDLDQRELARSSESRADAHRARIYRRPEAR